MSHSRTGSARYLLPPPDVGTTAPTFVPILGENVLDGDDNWVMSSNGHDGPYKATKPWAGSVSDGLSEKQDGAAPWAGFRIEDE